MRTFLCLIASAFVLSMASSSMACRSSEEDAASPAVTPPASTDAPVAASAAAPIAAPLETKSADDNAPRSRFVPIVRGTADVGYVAPVTKVEGRMIVTTFKVKNLSPQAIAGLKVEEFWRDKAGHLSGGSTDWLREPLPPGATATLTLRTPRNPRMFQNQYRFLHAYGDVKVEQLPRIE